MLVKSAAPSILSAESRFAEFASAKPENAKPHRSASQKFVRDICFSNLPIPFQKLRTYLWLVVLTKALGPEGFGAWSLFIVTLSSATTFSTLNCGSSMMRFLSGERSQNEINEAFSTVAAAVGGLCTAAAVAFLLCSRWLGWLIFRSSQDRVLILLLALALIFDAAFEEMKNLLRARRLNESWAYFSVARLFPEIILTIGVAIWFKQVIAVSFAYVMIGFCSVAAGIIYLAVRRNVRFVQPSRALLRKYLAFGLPLLPGVLASAVSYGADKYLVSYYLGLQQVGIYSVCFTLSAATFFLMGPINDVLFPELSALYDRGHDAAFRERFAGVQKFVFGISVGAAALMTAFPRSILHFLASHAFESGSVALAVLGVQGIFMAFVLLYVVILNVRMRVWSTTAFWIASGVGIVAMDMALLPRMGIAGAAVSQLAVTAAGAALLIGAHWHLFRKTFKSAWIAQAGAAFCGVYFLARLWVGEPTGVLQSLLRIGVGAAVFVVILFVTRYVHYSDVRMLGAALLPAE